MLLLACILIGTSTLRAVALWVMLDLREPMRRAGHLMSIAWALAAAGLALWIPVPMADLDDLRSNPDESPSMWQIVQIALPAATTIGVLAAATCAWIHVRHDLRRERRHYNE